jgi:hypothetical protein
MSAPDWSDDPRVPAAELAIGDVIYGADTVIALSRHPRHTWRVVVGTTGGEYSFPETTTVPVRRRCIMAGTGACSGDLLEVWHGLPVPLHLCGYHESRQDTRREGFRQNHERMAGAR